MLERLDLENRNGELWGVIVAGVDHCLSEGEVVHLKDHFNDFLDSLMGNLHGVAILGGKIHIYFRQCTEVFQQATRGLILTDSEMFRLQAPYNVLHLMKYPGFVIT